MTDLDQCKKELKLLCDRYPHFIVQAVADVLDNKEVKCKPNVGQLLRVASLLETVISDGAISPANWTKISDTADEFICIADSIDRQVINLLYP